MAGSLTDIFAAMQNGVVALGNFGRQTIGSFNNISGQLGVLTTAVAGAALSSTVPTTFVRTIAGNSSAFTLNGASGITNSTNDILLSQASSSQFGAVKVDKTTITASSGVISTVNPLPTPITNSLSSDHLMNNTANYFDGPSIAQGTSGTWWADGTVTLKDTGGVAEFECKLWDGTTVIASGSTTCFSLNAPLTVSLSGFITAPASNIKISVRDATRVTGVIQFNATGNSMDSTLTAIRIA